MRLGWQYPTATDGLDTAVRSAPTGGFHYVRHLSDWFAWGTDFDFLLFRKGRGELLAGRAPEQRLSGNTGAAFLTGRINLVFDRPWTIYVKGGGGIHRTRAKVTTLAGSQTKSQSSLAILAAGGAEAFILKNVSLLFEARFESFHLDRNKFGFDTAEFLVYHAGVSYWFGQH